MKRIVLTAMLLLSTALLYAYEDWNASVTYEKRIRDFTVYVPSGWQQGQKLPLVIVLHGGGGRSAQIAKYTGFSQLAEKENFIVAYPQGFDKQWNDGREVKQSRAHRLKLDDVGFIEKMIDEINAKYGIDESRVFACGISNGGFMSMRLAADLGGTIKGVAAVAAGMNPWLAENAKTHIKTAVLVINGTDDPLVPYSGGDVRIGKKTRGETLSTEETIAYWLKNNGCDKNKIKVKQIDTDQNDKTNIDVFDYNCAAPVVLYRVNGGGHTWPGAKPYLTEKIVGRVSRDINATEVIWEFFKKL